MIGTALYSLVLAFVINVEGLMAAATLVSHDIGSNRDNFGWNIIPKVNCSYTIQLRWPGITTVMKLFLCQDIGPHLSIKEFTCMEKEREAHSINHSVSSHLTHPSEEVAPSFS